MAITMAAQAAWSRQLTWLPEKRRSLRLRASWKPSSEKPLPAETQRHGARSISFEFRLRLGRGGTWRKVLARTTLGEGEGVDRLSHRPILSSSRWRPARSME